MGEEGPGCLLKSFDGALSRRVRGVWSRSCFCALWRMAVDCVPYSMIRPNMRVLGREEAVCAVRGMPRVAGWMTGWADTAAADRGSGCQVVAEGLGASGQVLG